MDFVPSPPTSQDPAFHSAERLRELVAARLHLPAEEVSDEQLRCHCAVLADRACRGLPAWVRQEMRGNALTILADSAEKYNPDRRASFGTFAHQILNRRGIDLVRSRERESQRLARYWEGRQPNYHADSREIHPEVDPVAREFECLRRTLDAAIWPAVRLGALNPQGIFLLNVRLAIARRVAQHAQEHDFPDPETPAAVAESGVPWNREEERLCPLKRELTLRVLWRTIRAELDRRWRRVRQRQAPISEVTDIPNAVCVALRRWFGGGLRENTWSVWVNRAKTRARELFAPSDWERFFARLFPDHTRTARID